MDGLTIIQDTRQKAGQHEGKMKALEAMGHSIVSCALPVGDYAVFPSVSVDTKADIYELYADLTGDHDRFHRECLKAREAGCALYILTIAPDVSNIDEFRTWQEPEKHFQMRKAAIRKRGKDDSKCRRMMGKTMLAQCETMARRYGTRFLFCRSEEECAEVIARILKGGDWHE